MYSPNVATTGDNNTHLIPGNSRPIPIGSQTQSENESTSINDKSDNEEHYIAPESKVSEYDYITK